MKNDNPMSWGLPARAMKAFERLNINCAGDLRRITRRCLLAIRNCGAVTVAEIERVACEHRVHLAKFCTLPSCYTYRWAEDGIGPGTRLPCQNRRVLRVQINLPKGMLARGLRRR